MRTTCCLVLVTALAACGGGGDWSAYEPDPGALPDDTVESVAYPAGPYNTHAGDRIANLVFEQAFFDPDMLCKNTQDLDLSRTQGVRSLSLHDIYKGDAYCPSRKKQFLFLIATAGW